MSIWSRLSEKKKELVDSARSRYKEYKTDKAEEKQLYKAEYKRARQYAIQDKARINADKIRKNAQKDADAGGKALRLAKGVVGRIRANQERRAKLNQNNQSQRRNFRI